MQETKMLASKYYKLTGKLLPVSNELACFYTKKILGFKSVDNIEKGVDLLGVNLWQDFKIQVKSRIILDKKQSRLMIGQISSDGTWDCILLVLLNQEYEPFEIYIAPRNLIMQNISERKSKRGSISIAKFKSISKKIWENEDISAGLFV